MEFLDIHEGKIIYDLPFGVGAYAKFARTRRRTTAHYSLVRPPHYGPLIVVVVGGHNRQKRFRQERKRRLLVGDRRRRISGRGRKGETSQQRRNGQHEGGTGETFADTHPPAQTERHVALVGLSCGT